MQIIDTIKAVLFHPTSFFASLKREKGVKEAFKYYVILSFFGAILSYLVSFFWVMPLLAPITDDSPLIGMHLISYLFGLPLSFVVAGILHLWILLWGGREFYTKTYQLYVYSLTPSFLLGWIPVLGLLALPYFAVLLILGTQHVHHLSRTKSIWMYLLPLLLLILLAALVLILGVTLLSSLDPATFQPTQPLS